jgi:hypothetical protein
VEAKEDEHGRDRTCNLLIRSQAPCHWATHPLISKSSTYNNIITSQNGYGENINTRS